MVKKSLKEFKVATYTNNFWTLFLNCATYRICDQFLVLELIYDASLEVKFEMDYTSFSYSSIAQFKTTLLVTKQEQAI